MSTFKDKVAVVTGGNSGIGLATAKAFAQEGARVVITGRKQELIDQAVTEIGHGATGMVADTADLAATDRLVARVKADHGRVDTLFINAGVAQFAPLEHTSEQQYDANFDVDAKGAFFTLQRFIPLLSEGSSVVLNASVAAALAMETSASYAGAKAAVIAFARTSARELAPKGIRVNSISPGPINTPLYGKLGMSPEQVQGFASALQERVPMKRFAAPEEVADLVLFLTSDKSSYITGIDIVIDGGVSLSPL